MRAQSFLFLAIKHVQKSESLVLKKLYQLQNRIFPNTFFVLKLNISGTLAYIDILGLFSKKKS